MTVCFPVGGPYKLADDTDDEAAVILAPFAAAAIPLHGSTARLESSAGRSGHGRQNTLTHTSHGESPGNNEILLDYHYALIRAQTGWERDRDIHILF